MKITSLVTLYFSSSGDSVITLEMLYPASNYHVLASSQDLCLNSTAYLKSGDNILKKFSSVLWYLIEKLGGSWIRIIPTLFVSSIGRIKSRNFVVSFSAFCSVFSWVMI